MSERKQEDDRRGRSEHALTSGSPTLPASGLSTSPAERLGELQNLSGKPGEGGTSLAHFRLLQEAGRGGMGVVYRAQDTLLDREVAIKVLSDELTAAPGFQERFVREAKIVARMADPNIPQIHFIGRAEGRLFFAMEWIDGRTVESLIREEGPVPVERALDIASQAARALQVAHRVGITHRDVKPSNLMLTREGVVKVLDFGVARSVVIHGDATMTSGFVGTPHYASPEQARGAPADARSDIYSLGATLFEILSGRRPFVGDNPMAVLTDRLVKPAPDLPEAVASVDVRRLVARMLATRPEDRFPDAGALLQAIRAVYPTAPVPARLSRRTLAFLTDLLVMGAPLAAIGLGFWAVKGFYPTTPLYGSIGGRLVLGLVLFAWLAGYHVLLGGRAGQSLGQRLHRIRLATRAGKKPALTAVSARAAIWWGPVCVAMAVQTDWPPVLASRWGGSDPERFAASDLSWILALIVPNLPWVLAQLWVFVIGGSVLVTRGRRGPADVLSRTEVVEEQLPGVPITHRRGHPDSWRSRLALPGQGFRPALTAAVLLLWMAGVVYVGSEVWRTLGGTVYRDRHLFETIKSGQPGWDRFSTRFLREFLRQGDLARNPEVLIFERHPVLPLLFAGAPRTEDPDGSHSGFNPNALILDNSSYGVRTYFDMRGTAALGGLHAYLRYCITSAEELAPVGEKQARRWDEARRRAYRGSVRHFVRALMHQRLEEEGFEVLNPEDFVGLFRTDEISIPVSEAGARGEARATFTLVAWPELKVRIPGSEDTKRLTLVKGWALVTPTGRVYGSWGGWDFYALPGTVLESYAAEQDKQWGTPTENIQRVVTLH